MRSEFGSKQLEAKQKRQKAFDFFSIQLKEEVKFELSYLQIQCAYLPDRVSTDEFSLECLAFPVKPQKNAREDLVIKEPFFVKNV